MLFYVKSKMSNSQALLFVSQQHTLCAHPQQGTQLAATIGDTFTGFTATLLLVRRPPKAKPMPAEADAL